MKKAAGLEEPPKVAAPAKAAADDSKPKSASESKRPRPTLLPKSLEEELLAAAREADPNAESQPIAIGGIFGSTRTGSGLPTAFVATASQHSEGGEIVAKNSIAGVNQPRSECFGIFVLHDSTSKTTSILPGTAVLVKSKSGVTAYPAGFVGDQPILNEKNLEESLREMFSGFRVDYLPTLAENLVDFELGKKILALLEKDENFIQVFIPQPEDHSPWISAPPSPEEILSRLQLAMQHIATIRISKPRAPSKSKSAKTADETEQPDNDDEEEDTESQIDHVSDDDSQPMDEDPPSATKAEPKASATKAEQKPSATKTEPKTSATKTEPKPSSVLKFSMSAPKAAAASKSTAPASKTHPSIKITLPAAKRVRVEDEEEEENIPPAKRKAVADLTGKPSRLADSAGKPTPFVVVLPESLLPEVQIPIDLYNRGKDLFGKMGAIALSTTRHKVTLTITAPKLTDKMAHELDELFKQAPEEFTMLSSDVTMSQTIIIDPADKTRPVTVAQADGTHVTGTLKAMQATASPVLLALIKYKMMAHEMMGNEEEEEAEEDEGEAEEEMIEEEDEDEDN